jgi:GntR family transcriptional regulator
MIYWACDPGRATMPPYKFERVAESLREQIRSGKLPKGSALPSTKQLIAEYDVSYGTVRDAIRQLKAEGLIEGRQGDGVYVL